MLERDQPLTYQTGTSLLGLIHDNDLQPMDLLPSEPELTQTFGVSRNILREAVGYLKGMGVLQSKRGSGVSVCDIDPVDVFGRIMKVVINLPGTDLGRLFALRRTLEMGVIDAAVVQATPEQCARIDELATACEQQVAGNPRDATAYQRIDVQFHRAITEPAAFDLLDMINDVVAEFFHRTYPETGAANPKIDAQTLRNSAREHRIIAAAFLTRQPTVALLCLRDHLAHYDFRKPAQRTPPEGA